MLSRLAGFIIMVLIALWLITTFWHLLLPVTVVGGFLYFMYKNNTKKKTEAHINWVPNHIKELESKATNRLSKAATLQKELINSDHYVTKAPSKEQATVYHTLDERKEYLDHVENLMQETYNRVVLPKFPYLPVANSLHSIESSFYHFREMMDGLWNGFDHQSDTDVGKIAEKEMFLKNGVDLEYLSQARNYLMDQFHDFWNSVIKTGENNSFVIEKKIINAGLVGEKRLQEELEMYTDVWNSLYNIRLEVEGNSVESDAVIVSPKGIFTLEAKNFSSSGSYQIRIKRDGQWQKVLSNGNAEPMKDVVSQANRHVAYKQRFINESLRNKGITTDYIPVQSIIVIANDNVMIENESDIPVIRVSQIYNFIQKQPTTLSPELVTEVTELLEKNSLQAKAFPHRSYEKELEQWLEFLIPTAVYSYQAGMAHASVYNEIAAKNPSLLNNYITLEEGLSYPLSSDMELAKEHHKIYE